MNSNKSFEEFLRAKGYSENTVRNGKLIEKKVNSAFKEVPENIDEIIKKLKSIKPMPKSTEGHTKSMLRLYLRWLK